MDDAAIVELYWQRSESAISATQAKYGAYCRATAYNILQESRDAEECVNSTYWQAWNAMPEHRPKRLQAFLGKLTRNLSLNTRERYSAQKRGAGQVELLLSELEECIPADGQVEQALDDGAIAEALNVYLSQQPARARCFFVRRYWYAERVSDIALRYGVGESLVKTSLFRMRKALKVYLEQKGINL
ncbi:MAG: sigma-70 family RNA polymerase sigma factor [Chloroflexi bacterium]|mgnify:CR=1 FL=1|nr:sigma-70 family RNA polymerase sigma factor [Chloroflexota bacterium]